VASTDLRRLLASEHINNAYGPDEQVGEAFKDACHKGYGEGGRWRFGNILQYSAPILPYNSIMRVAIFSTKSYDRAFLEAANATYGHELVFFEPRLTEETTALAAQFQAVCAFVAVPPENPISR
jgi:hypothetical protein